MRKSRQEKTEPPSTEIRHVHKTMLDYIPFWQGMGFVLMIVLVWAVYLFELPEYFFSRETETDWFGLSLITAVIIVMGFVIVAHSYVQQRRILQGLLRVCSYCKKVKIKQSEEWMQLEYYVSENSLADFTHGICPDCHQRVMRELGKDKEESEGAVESSEAEEGN